jgi:transposase
MRQKSVTPNGSSKQIVKNIRQATRKHYSAEDKIRIVLDGLRGEYSIAELCRREGMAESLYYSWSEEFLEAGKRRLAGDTVRAATTDEVKDLRREAQELKVVVPEFATDFGLGGPSESRLNRPRSTDIHRYLSTDSPAAAQQQPTSEVLEYKGTVASSQEAEVAPRLDGLLTKINFTAGQRVKKGARGVGQASMAAVAGASGPSRI